MKVVHIATMLKGGAGIAALRIHQSLLDYAPGVTSFFIQKDPVIDSNDIKRNIYQCTHYHNLYYKIVNKLGLKSYLTQEGIFRRIISKYPKNYEIATLPLSYYPIEDHPIIKDADIIHLHWIGDFINYPSFFKKIKQPIVCTTHDPNPFLGIFHYEGDVLRNPGNLRKLEDKAIGIKYKYTHTHNNIHIACPSEWVKQKSETSYVLDDFPHYYIPYGIEEKNYPLLDKIVLKEEFKINNGKKTILFIAFDIQLPRKGLDLLIDAVNRIDPSKFNLISVGHGNKISINSKINFQHYENIQDISELNKIYAAADVTIVPSREDMFNQVMLESLMNGTPVISFSNGGMAEHIKTGKNGILIDEISSQSLQFEIENFLNDKYSFEEPHIIRNYPVTTLNNQIQAKRYTELYNKILT